MGVQAPPSSCNVFIQAWVDVNSIVQGGGPEGVYLVDNKVGQGSTGEGGQSLSTQCTVGDSVCWIVQSIDPNAEVTQLEIAEISNSQAWGPGGQPEAYQGSSQTIFTGTVENTGSNGYSLILNVNNNTVQLNNLGIQAS